MPEEAEKRALVEIVQNLKQDQLDFTPYGLNRPKLIGTYGGYDLIGMVTSGDLNGNDPNSSFPYSATKVLLRDLALCGVGVADTIHAGHPGFTNMKFIFREGESGQEPHFYAQEGD
jgi:hypothetical protein